MSDWKTPITERQLSSLLLEFAAEVTGSLILYFIFDYMGVW